jgi:hypothetical protein
MTNNKQQTAEMNSLQFYITERNELEIKSRYLEIKPDKYAKELIALDSKAREMYQDEIEAAIIKNCATESTSEASQYASGYSNGYQRALEMVKWKIDNELRSK